MTTSIACPLCGSPFVHYTINSDNTLRYHVRAMCARGCGVIAQASQPLSKWTPPAINPGERRLPKVGTMVIVTSLAPEETEVVPLNQPVRIKALHAVRMDGWLRLSFEGQDWGGMGGIWCRVATLDLADNVVMVGHSGWGPEP